MSTQPDPAETGAELYRFQARMDAEELEILRIVAKAQLGSRNSALRHLIRMGWREWQAGARCLTLTDPDVTAAVHGDVTPKGDKAS